MAKLVEALFSVVNRPLVHKEEEHANDARKTVVAYVYV